MSSIFSFLIATDCHLGYEETDHIIGDDSFITFEEILIKAVEEEVDLILLGGDLFHHNNPSQRCMHKCMELLRRYTLGDRPVYFELLCNAAEVFSNSISQKTTNYLDENINVSIPVFSIHGNHDDPSGIAQACALDTLSSAGLINYFGKWTNFQDVVIKPILLRKGKTRIALYGLSHMKDDRLCRLFMDNKVKFLRPENEPNEWFNIFVLHQNRADRGPKRFISESYIPDFMDLVIWGHEHDCEIEPIQNLEKGFYVIQPGSSVPTSLCEGESLEKHVAVLEVYKKKMKIRPLKLNTVRPFVWRSVNLWDINVAADEGEREKKSQEIQTRCRQIIEEMLTDAKKLLTGHIKQPKLPLVRLRCLYSDETQLFNIVKFGQLFDKMVANPIGEIIRLKRSFSKSGVKKEKSEDLARLNELYKQDMEDAGNFTACVNHIIKDYFTNHEESKMLLLRVGVIVAMNLALNGEEDLKKTGKPFIIHKAMSFEVLKMGTAVEKFIDKDDMFVIEELIDSRYEKILYELTKEKINVDETNLKEYFEKLRKEDEKKELKNEKELQKKIDEFQKENVNAGSGIRNKSNVENGDDFSDPDIFNEENDEKKIVSDSATDEYDVDNELSHDILSSKSKGKKGNDFSDSSDEFGFERKRGSKKTDDDESKISGRGRGRGRGRGSRGGGENKKGKTSADTSFLKLQKRSTPRGGGKTRQPLNFQNAINYASDSD